MQQELFADSTPAFDGAYTGIQRRALGGLAWVEQAEGWVRGADVLFEIVLASRSWAQRTRWMYDREVLEPRLTAPWSLETGLPLEPALLEEMRASLSQRYGVQLDSVGFNLIPRRRELPRVEQRARELGPEARSSDRTSPAAGEAVGWVLGGHPA